MNYTVLETADPGHFKYFIRIARMLEFDTVRKWLSQTYQRQLNQLEENALDCYVRQQRKWRTAALRNGLDISDFVP